MSLKIDISRLEPFAFLQTIESFDALIKSYNMLHELWQQYVGYNDGRTFNKNIYIKTLSLLNDFETEELLATNEQADSLESEIY